MEIDVHVITVNSSKKSWIDGTTAHYVNWEDYKFRYFFGAMIKVWPGTEKKRGRWTTKPKTNACRFVCSRYREGIFAIHEGTICVIFYYTKQRFMQSVAIISTHNNYVWHQLDE